jgi:hypothetical protein
MTTMKNNILEVLVLIFNLNFKYIVISNQHRVHTWYVIFNMEWNSFGKVDMNLKMAIYSRNM